MNFKSPKHQSSYPTPRKIRRACSKELYRTVKRLQTYIPENLIKEGETLYYRKVIGNLIWIHEQTGNRNRLADWWDEEVSEELAELWKVKPDELKRAFREAFCGGATR